MTAEEFAQRYALDSGVTVDYLRLNGRYPEPCTCGQDGCLGWKMGHQQEDALVELPPAKWRQLDYRGYRLVENPLTRNVFIYAPSPVYNDYRGSWSCAIVAGSLVMVRYDFDGARAWVDERKWAPR